jgi:hypothetical protein
MPFSEYSSCVQLLVLIGVAVCRRKYLRGYLDQDTELMIDEKVINERRIKWQELSNSM